MSALSVVICCANVEDTLRGACESVKWADEVIVVDSGSDDATPQIAKDHAHRYVLEPWRGYAGQKLFAAELCTHDWIFFLDGDEECSPQLTAEWQALTDEQLRYYDLLLVPRKNYVMQRLVRSWWPDRITRIFHRRRCTWSDEVLHDTRQPSDRRRMRKLKGWIIHKRRSAAGFGDYFSGKRMDERLLMVAGDQYAKGKCCHWWDLVVRPGAAFWKSYLFKRGFLCGTFGLLIAQKMAVSTQLKYAALWAVQQKAKEKEKRGEGQYIEKGDTSSPL